MINKDYISSIGRATNLSVCRLQVRILYVVHKYYYICNIVSLPLVTIQRLDRGSTPRISTTPAKEKAALVDNSKPPGTNIINGDVLAFDKLVR